MSELSAYGINSRQTWQQLLDETRTALNLPTALLGPNNIILQRSGERNELCKEIRGRKKALPAICGQSQQFMAKTARTQKTVVVEICEAGMAKFVVPVFHGQNYLGCIASCGSFINFTQERNLMETTEALLIMKATDNIAIAVRQIEAGESVSDVDQKVSVVATEIIPFGFKIAIREIADGDLIFKYGEPIGKSVGAISAGQLVHVHNIVGLRGRGDL